MKNKTIYLEAAKEKNRLKIGLHRPDEVIWRYEEVSVPMDRIQMRCREVIETLNMTSQQGGGGPQAYDRLKSVGRMLGDELLTPSIKEQLSGTDAVYLILNIDDQLVHIPWELLCIDQEFLCQRFNMGRLVKTRQKIAKAGARPLARPLKMWILADPGGDLEVAGSEGLKIFQDMARFNTESAIIEPVLDSDITADEIREYLKNYDFVHFAGHVDYDTDHPIQSGWRLDGGRFSAGDIDKMGGGAPMPTMIFSNACESARTEEWAWEDREDTGSFGLPNAFLRSGVKHYVGTCWEVVDEPSSYFAHEFYELLRSGKTIGEAVNQARRNLTERHGPDICWVSYVLYGDPTLRYFREDRETPEPVTRPRKPEAATPIRPVSRNTVLTRGKLFNYSLNTFKLKEMQNWFYAVAALAVIALTIISGVFANRWFVYSEQKAAAAQQLQIEQMLVSRAERQQARTERLFDELADMVEPLPPSGQTRSDAVTIATVFDSQTLKLGKARMILHAVQDQIIQSGLGFTLLEQESFDVILEELIRNIRLSPADNRIRPDLLTPRLILFLDIHDTGETTMVLMRLVDKENRRVLDTLFAEVNNSQRILAQKEPLTKNLLQKLKKYESNLSL